MNKNNVLANFVKTPWGRRILVSSGVLALSAVAFCQDPPPYSIDYSTHMITLAGYLRTMITTNVGALFGILALCVGFLFVWRHVKRLAKSV